MAARTRVLIADDEPAARRRLKRLLSNEADVEVVGQAGSGPEAAKLIEELRPDLAFLDVQMPGMSGIDVVKHVGADRMPVVIFVTAYDEYAVNAFELAALDYLLKPFDDERFRQALERARRFLARDALDEATDRLEALLQTLASGEEEETSRPGYLERIAVHMRGQIRIVPIDRISYISANGGYVDVHVGEERLLLEEQMKNLEEQLPPDKFFRIHRSYIVRLNEVDLLLVRPGGDYAVRLHSGKHLSVSRSRWGELAFRLGIKVPEE